MKVNGSSGVTAAARASSSACSRRRPRSRNASRLTVPAGAPSASSTTIVVSAGSWSRTASIFAACSASSQTISRASESATT